MKVDLSKEIYREIETLIQKLTSSYKDISQFDEMYLEVKGVMDGEDLGMVFYPELLTYGNGGTRGADPQVVPWICVRFEIENPDDNKVREALKEMVNRFEKIDHKPFHDEDAYNGYFNKNDRTGWTQYKMYVNPDYPKGAWENHTL